MEMEATTATATARKPRSARIPGLAVVLNRGAPCGPCPRKSDFRDPGTSSTLRDAERPEVPRATSSESPESVAFSIRPGVVSSYCRTETDEPSPWLVRPSSGRFRWRPMKYVCPTVSRSAAYPNITPGEDGGRSVSDTRTASERSDTVGRRRLNIRCRRIPRRRIDIPSQSLRASVRQYARAGGRTTIGSPARFFDHVFARERGHRAVRGAADRSSDTKRERSDRLESEREGTIRERPKATRRRRATDRGKE